MLYTYEQLGIPIRSFVPLQLDRPMDMDLLCSVERAPGSQPDGKKPTYAMSHPPPFYIYSEETPVKDDIMSAWIMHATAVLRTTNFPVEAGETAVFNEANSMVSALRLQSNPILGTVTQWTPQLWTIAAMMKRKSKRE